MKTTRFPKTCSGVTERMSGFMAHLRNNGLPVGVAETAKTLQSLQLIDINNHNEVRLACKVICATNSDGFERFDVLFDSYWLNRGRESAGIANTETRQHKKNESSFHPGIDNTREASGAGELESADDQQSDGDDDTGTNQGGEGKLVASTVKNLEKIDFRELMTPESLKQAEVLAARLASAMRDRRSRRRHAAKRGAQLDLRRIMRASLSHGGVPLELYKRHRPDRPVKVVALLDVSGSMTVYAKVFLSFLKGLISHDQKTDAYLFHTTLVRISDALRDHDTLRAVNRLSIMAQGFGGGTKIGSNLQLFNQQYASLTVDSRTVVIILSDGYDTDPPELLVEGLAKLKKRNCRIVWLNPLKGWKDYAPVAQGMSASLPYIDHFAAANTLQSLAELEPQLARL